jgi:hypothetical protein
VAPTSIPCSSSSITRTSRPAAGYLKPSKLALHTTIQRIDEQRRQSGETAKWEQELADLQKNLGRGLVWVSCLSFPNKAWGHENRVPVPITVGKLKLSSPIVVITDHKHRFPNYLRDGNLVFFRQPSQQSGR